MALSYTESTEQDGIQVLDKGRIECLVAQAQDLDVVNAARVSFHTEEYEMNDRNSGLIRFLMREKHGTPFEHGFFKFRVKAPLFVFREWHRHRVGHSYNEWSARYSQLDPDFYIPKVEDVVTQTGKPGNYEFARHYDLEDAQNFVETLQYMSETAFSAYEHAIAKGIAKQQARLFLPVNTYSEMIWSCNPRSLMHFISLRNSNQAQAEIREYAQVVEQFFHATMPVTYKAFIDGGRVAP
jgi:thymidylate synthase (FAD)